MGCNALGDGGSGGIAAADVDGGGEDHALDHGFGCVSAGGDDGSGGSGEDVHGCVVVADE